MLKLKLKKQLKKLNTIVTINMGGCAVSAIAIYRWLKSQGVKPKDLVFAFVYRWVDDSLHHNQKVLKSDSNNNLEAPQHCVIKYKNKYYDSEGEIDIKKYIYCLEFRKLKQILDCVNDFGWNCDFRRKIELPKIEKMLNINLKDIQRGEKN